MFSFVQFLAHINLIISVQLNYFLNKNQSNRPYLHPYLNVVYLNEICMVLH